MNKKPRSRPRRYDNALRAEQAGQTADRILDAVHARISGGDREISYAAVARQARVSVPTVYRHFPTVDDIFRAYAAREQRGYGVVKADRASLAGGVRTFFARFDDPDDLLGKPPRLNQMWQFSRVGTVPQRRIFMEALVDEAAPHLGAHERTMVVDAGVVVVSSAMGEALRGYLGLDGAAMAERVTLILEALFAHAQRLSAARNPKKTARGKS